MKRMVENVFNIIDVVGNVLMIGTGLVFLFLKNNDAFLSYLDANWTKSQNDYTLDELSQAGTMFILPGIIGLVLGILAIYLSKNNRDRKIVGWMLLVISVGSCFVSLFAAIPNLFYMIAGIIMLVGNPKKIRA
ncbi:DUF4064 domain-containing protein [Cohnella sp. REN36]|uniref:DUF4064 domain-containing protein n=1 Tax=Cohnella sp. REN36 TaxID=2887347 RepID=UPI001D1577FA|nr:DUF4064 domain-containing protein [Cohnella sp. REN36]MCC3371976.1 DUF4064 domain-containing protein [Cohnella sp. REN36]